MGTSDNQGKDESTFQRRTDGDDLAKIHSNSYRITKFIWTRSAYGLKNPHKDTTKDSSSQLPGLVSESICRILESIDAIEVAIEMPGCHEIFIFRNAEFQDGPDDDLNTEHKQKYGNLTLDPDAIQRAPAPLIGGDSNVVAGMIIGKPKAECLVVTSEPVPPLQDSQIPKSLCSMYFLLEKDELKEIKRCIDNYSGEDKNKAVYKYRLAANMIVSVLAPSAQQFSRYSRYMMLSELNRCIKKPWEEKINFPWQRGQPIPTVTVALDLRKSTFSMTFALTQQGFANWMKITLKSLRRIADKYGAIFDKFTGDGVIVHFASIHGNDAEAKLMEMLDGGDYRKLFRDLIEGYDLRFTDLKAAREDGNYGNETRLLLAYCCGWEMLLAMKYHTNRLRALLTRGHSGLGATVGIGMGYATWSVDRDRNPIVVGPGVVGACRAVDSGQAGHMVVPPTVLSRLSAMGLAGNDFPAAQSKKYDTDENEHYYSLPDICRAIPVSARVVEQEMEEDYKLHDDAEDILRLYPIAF